MSSYTVIGSYTLIIEDEYAECRIFKGSPVFRAEELTGKKYLTG
jgi:hypothetical protein